MKRLAALSLSLMVVLVSCNKPKPTVVLDGWWNVDYAKGNCSNAKKWMKENSALINQLGCEMVTSCPEMTKVHEACVVDDSGGISDFQVELASQFASAKECSDVQFVQFNNPTEKNKKASNSMAGTHWSLMIDFVPGSQEQPWSLVGPSSQVLKGTGRAKDIVNRVCIIASERGAKVSN
ncbi:MAG: hypothetical protein WCA78_11415 [Rhizomicrobium sp.]